MTKVGHTDNKSLSKYNKKVTAGSYSMHIGIHHYLKGETISDSA
jgi:hypothetical protein